MSEWKEYKLGDFADIQTGPFGSQLHASDYVIVGTPSIMPTNIGSRLNIVTDEIVYVGEQDIERLKKYTVVQNDIVYSRRGDVEKCALVNEKQNGWLCGTGCLRIRFKNKNIIPKFCAYYLSTPDIKSWVLNSAVGTTMPNLNSTILTQLPLFIPDKNQQEAIAEILASLDDKIDLLQRQNETLEQLAETIFRQWFVEEADKNKLYKLGHLIETTIGGEWGKEIPEGEYIVEVNCIRGTDIADLQNGLAARIPTRFIKEKKFQTVEAKDGDLIIEISGGSDDQATGRTVYINNDVKSLFNYPLIFSNFCRLIRPKKKEFTFFLYSYIQFLYNQGDFFNLENGTSGIRNFNYKAFLFELEYPMPDEAKIIEYNCRIKDYFKKVNTNKHQIKQLTQLRDALLPKLMSGEVKLNDK